MRILDLFCGAGGAAMGMHRALPDAEIIGVDINPQKHYPFTFVLGNALNLPFDLRYFDFIWASPPCQAYSAMKTMRNASRHPKLIEPVRAMLEDSGKSFVIENVGGAPLQNALMICGSHLGLSAHNGYQLRRHRFFESNVMLLGQTCCHAQKTVGVYGGKVRDIAQEKRHYKQDKATRGAPVGVVLGKEIGFEAMGIDWMSQDELSEAIPPAYSEYILKQIFPSA